MKAANSLARTDKRVAFSAAVTGDALQNLIRKSVPDAASAARLTGALISAVAANDNLKACQPATVVAAALRGEGMGLTLGTGYYLVPYGDKCQYQIGYKGLLALLIATGEVADTDCVPVREGELIGRDRRTSRARIDFSVYDTDEEAQKHPIIGYYFYVELRNGYFRYEYMPVDSILRHAEQYSKAFSRERYDRLHSKDCPKQEAERIMASSPWYSNTEIMMKKTVIRRLLNSGFVPLSNSARLDRALQADIEELELIENEQADDGPDETAQEPGIEAAESAREEQPAGAEKDGKKAKEKTPKLTSKKEAAVEPVTADTDTTYKGEFF